MITYIIVAAVIAQVSTAGFCGWLAQRKGRSYDSWAMLGLLFGPIALLALVGAPDE